MVHYSFIGEEGRYMNVFKKLIAELEKPRSDRPLGSGWLSGAGAILAGLTGFLLIVVLRYPSWFTTPELAFLYEKGIIKPLLHVVLILGYVFALISLILNRSKVLGTTGLALVVVAALLGGSQSEAAAVNGTSLYFGLDFFVLNVLFVGFLFVPLERFFPARPEQTVFRQEWREDMLYYFISSMLVQVLTFLTMAPTNYVTGHVNLEHVQSWVGGLPFFVQVILIMIATDFLQYWLHRLFHTVPFLWRFHAVHHSAEKMDWLAGARMHFFEIAVLRGVTAIPMFSLGFDPAAIQVYVLVVYFYSSLVHANIGWNLKLIEPFMVTPRFHHWHHGLEQEAIDVNFAIHFPLYDRIFGTYHMPEGEEGKGRWPKAYGVARGPVPKGYWKQFWFPFSKPKS